MDLVLVLGAEFVLMHRSKTRVSGQVEHDLISLEMTLSGYPA